MGRDYRGNDTLRLDRVRAGVRAFLIAAVSFLLACDTETRTEDGVTDNEHPSIVTLAPSLAELVFAAGAGEYLVGVSAYSDYPPSVQALPLIGDAFTIDQEQLALLKPDLLLAWQSGTPEHVVDELRSIGYRVESIRTRQLADISSAISRIGRFAGTADKAEQAATEFESSLRALAREHQQASRIRVFYQVSARPLYTVSGDHYASELIELCGGVNVFAELEQLAPAIDVEAVVDRDPEVILAGSDAGDDAFADWHRWPGIAASRFDNFYFLPGDEIGRPTTRVIIAGKALCDALRQARQRRADYSEAAID